MDGAGDGMDGWMVEWKCLPSLTDLLWCVQDLGVTKVGHMKRILQGIRELNRNSSASEA